MAFSRSSLSDLELRYPFTPRSRQFFEKVPLDEALASGDVIAQSKSRLLNSLGRGKYEITFTDTDLSSFFACALVASQDPVLASKYSRKEADRAKEFFKEEKPKDKVAIMAECFGVTFQTEGSDGGLANYVVPFEGYLALISKHELARNQVWKLARQSLDRGIIHMNDNKLNDFFGDCARAAISEGVRNLRKGSLPKQLLGVKMDVMQYVPAPRPRTSNRYQYIETLLQSSMGDGRHRVVWILLAPYEINVVGAEDDVAVERIRRFVATGGESSQMRRFIEYNVRRARRLGLMPPTLAKLKAEHPDIFALLPKNVIEASIGEPKTEGKPSNTRRT